MAWNGSSGWQTGSNGQSSFYPDGMQPHYANAFCAQGGYYAHPVVPHPMQITVPSPGFARNQPMASLVPIHMRNRVGPVRCGHEGCLFAGSHKEVEVHKMDRHLIFPPGWEEDQARKKRKRGKERGEGEDEKYVDEEAQFRATGAAAILGTDTKLDSPEAIAAWLEERKKRWPSAKRVTEKAQNRQEALERGQIITEPRRLNTGGGNRGGAGSQRGRGRGRGRGRETVRHTPGPGEGGNRGADKGWGSRARGRGAGTGPGNVTGGERGRGRGRGRGAANPVPPARAPNSSKQDATHVSTSGSSTSTDSSSASDSDSSTSSDSGDGSESDMDPVRDAVSSKVAPVEKMHMDVDPAGGSEREPAGDINQKPASNQSDAQIKKQPFKRHTVNPPRPAYNPFNQRPNLLQNLLMPDIQATVSHLSQAIRFLVANDFLENVELKPGDAENVLVQPVVARPTE